MTSDTCHPIVAATRDAAQRWQLLADGRTQPFYEPGLVEIRVSRPQLERALSMLQELIDGALDCGLEVGPVVRARCQRAGVGIGRAAHLVPVHLVEIRTLVPFDQLDIDEWRSATPAWSVREFELRDRGWAPRPSGRLRLRLPRRHDRPPREEAGWRFSFTDQVGRPLERQIADAVQALVGRADRDAPSR